MAMGEKIESFIDEVRNSPTFRDASRIDPAAVDNLAGLKRSLELIDRRANTDPHMVGILDHVEAVIANTDQSLKDRLVEVTKVFGLLRDAGRNLN